MSRVPTTDGARLSDFLDLSRVLAQLKDMNEVVSALSVFLADKIPHDHLDLMFVLTDEREFGVVFETGAATDWADSLSHPVLLSEGPIRSLFDRRAPYLLVGDALNDPRFKEPGIVRTPLIQAQLRSRINLPMLAGDDVLGAFNISLSKADKYSHADLDYARGLVELLTPFLLAVFRGEEYRHAANLSAARAADARQRADGDKRLKDISAQMPGVVFQFLAAGDERRMTYVSPSVSDVFGLDPDPEGFAERFVTRIHPDERGDFLSGINDVVEAMAPWHFQGRFLKEDGEEISFVGMSQPSPTPNGLLYHGFLLDMSEQKRKDETFRRLSSAIDVIEHGVAILDSDDRYFYVNQRYRGFGGRAQSTLEVGCRFEDHIRELVDLGVIPLAEDEREDWIRRRMETHRSLPSSSLVDQGEGEWLLIREERLPDGGIAMIVTDVSELRHAQDRLRDALGRAESASQAKSEFLATMSHEFRTPLNAILGFSEIISNELFGPVGIRPYAGYAKDIHNSGRHMLDLVNDVLDFSALEVGKREFRPEPVDVGKTIARCLREIHQAAGEKRIKLKTCLAVDLPVIVTDQRSLRQCLINTMSNAVKYTEPSGQVDIIANMVGGHLRIIVQDDGVGIAKDRLNRITEPFAQADNDPLRTREGTGLGLSIVKSLLEGQGGKLEIESAVGKGTTVTMVLPVSA